MKEENDAGNSEMLERLASHHLMSPLNHLLPPKQDSPPLASSSPSPASVSSITSIAKVSSSTNGNGTSNISPHTPPLKRPRNSFDAVDIVRAQLYGNALVTIGNDLAAAAAAASGLTFPSTFPSIGAEQSRLLMQELANVAARTALSSANSSRSKSSSSEGSNGGSPLSSLSLTLNTKPGVKPRSADSPGSGSTTSTTGSREKVFVCQICNRSFGYKHVLQNHERTHTGEKPFECRECHKRFTRDHHLKTHMRLHTGEKPYHCTHCDRQFVQVANLRRHLRVHTGERPYACELCSSRFSDSNQLKAHMLIHKGEKPFECIKCMGRFRRRHHLMHHKCPKDEANLGKPRRGRRPKAYDQIQSASPISLSSSADDLLSRRMPLMNAAAAVSSTTANPISKNFYHHASKPPTSHQLPHLRPPPPSALSSSTSIPSAHHFADHELPPKSRRKPRHTIRILSQPQHSDLYADLDREDEVQTQPLNLSISPGLTAPKSLASHLGLNSRRAYNSPHGTTDDNALDLSRSRSDAESEPEPIEEDEDDDDVLVKEEDDEIEDGVLLNQNYGDIENAKDRFKRCHLAFNSHFTNNHIKNHRSTNSLSSVFASQFQNMDEKGMSNGNGISSLDLAAFSLSKLENLKAVSASPNRVSVPLIKSKSSSEDNNNAPESSLLSMIKD